jgi:Uma2 family endonuclease
MESDIALNGFGSWTLKNELRESGAEPDECYIVGDSVEKEVPDLAIEVEWSRVTGLSKPEIYRRLGVQELWTMKSDGRLTIRVLEKGDWVERTKSKLLPRLDLSWLLSFLDIEPQSRAARSLREKRRS